MNVVFIWLDDAPPDTGNGMPYLYGNPAGSWVTFPFSYVAAPVCAPSRESVLSGVHVHNHPAAEEVSGWSGVDRGWNAAQWYPASLQAGGVHTGFIGKWHGFDASGSEPFHVPEGIDHMRIMPNLVYNSGTGKIIDETGSQTTYDGSTIYQIDKEAELAVDFVTNAPQPFCLSWHSAAPHQKGASSYPPAPRHSATSVTVTETANFNEPDVSDKAPSWVADHPLLDAGVVATTNADHANALRILLSLDEAIEDMIGALSSRGILDDTVIIFGTDNTNCFGAHRHILKTIPYEDATNMQTRVRWPGHAGGTNDALVSAVDIAPTLADIFNCTLRTPSDGMSIVPLLDGTLAPEDFRSDLLVALPVGTVDAARFQQLATYDGIRYIDWLNGEAELYDITTDPHQLASTTKVPVEPWASRLSSLIDSVTWDGLEET